LPDLKIGLSPAARKEFEKLEIRLQEQIQQRLKVLAANPNDQRVAQKLVGYSELKKSRIGSHRILFEVRPFEGQSILYVVAIGHRKDVYRKL
jgi:mRNA-degrading endonuclease RelE of RelBE toxin-antitoxin system